MPRISVTASIIAIAILLGLAGSLAQTGEGGAGGAASGPSAGSGSPVGSPSAGSAGAGTTGVNGVPSGPANAGGLNNSGNDPSGAGNSAKLALATATGHQQRRHGQFVLVLRRHIIDDDRLCSIRPWGQFGDRSIGEWRCRCRCRRQSHRSQTEKYLSRLLAFLIMRKPRPVAEN